MRFWVVCNKTKQQNKTHVTRTKKKILTLAPFDSKQLSDYLTVDSKLNKDDAKKLSGVINEEFIPHMSEIKDLVEFAKNKTGAIDFEKVAQFIETYKQDLVTTIAEICSSAQERRNLKEFVEEKKDSPFASYELVEKFGRLENRETVGYRLLHHNLLFFQCESMVLMFHAPIVRNAISELATSTA